MARRDFGAMLSTIDKATEAPEPGVETEPAARVAPATPAPSTKAKVDKPTSNAGGASRRAAPKSTESPRSNSARGVAGGVGFDQLERKETRLSADQYAELTMIARDLNRRRAGEGHRITENTLIRLGIDLLRERAGDLSGTTEAELRASLRLS